MDKADEIKNRDSLFHQLYPQVILFLEQFFDINKEAHGAVDLTFAPEIWGGVLATVLGTLIIVIAIAAAIAMTIINVPKTVANTPPHISGAKVRSTAP